MSQTAKNASKQLLNTQNCTEEESTSKENYSEKNVVFEKIPDTPFNVVGDKEYGYFAVCGTYAITEKFNSVEEVITYVIMQPYELLITLITMVIHATDEMKEKQPKEYNEILKGEILNFKLPK